MSSSLRRDIEFGDFGRLRGVAAGVGLEETGIYLPVVVGDAVVGEVVRGQLELHALGGAGL